MPSKRQTLLSEGEAVRNHLIASHSMIDMEFLMNVTYASNFLDVNSFRNQALVTMSLKL